MTDNQKKIFAPYKIDKKSGIMKYVKMDKHLIDFRTIISEIEDKIIKSRKKTSNNIVGITEDARMKLKIKGIKGDKLGDYYDKIKDKLQDFMQEINEKSMDYIDMTTEFIQTEKEDMELSKKLIQIRNKMQPNCGSNKYKTSGFFSSAFSEKLEFTSA